MPTSGAATIGKILYGALFALVLPIALVAWARATAPVVAIPMIRSLPIGAALAAAGAALMATGMWALRVHGGGLPMNAFPPPKLVSRGAFRLFANPIYVGFCFACAGVSIATGSASGLYLVTPTMVMACTALVMGYEGPSLRARLGARPNAWMHVAPDDDAPPSFSERLAAYAIAIAPWIAIYELVAGTGIAPDAFSLETALDRSLPVVEEAELVYGSIYVVVLAAPLAARTRRDLRAFEVRALVAMALVFPIYLALPVIAAPRAFSPHGPLGAALALERTLDTPAEAFPSFHVVWAFIAAGIYGARSRAWRSIALAWAALVTMSCVATGMHTIADVVGGLVAFGIVARASAIWERVRRWAERLANSWREWRLGPVRVISHGAYAGLGTALALGIVGALVGPGHSAAIAVTALGGLVAAAVWAQLLEGSSQLMRPYGFYGGLLGIVVASLFAPLLGTGTWTILAAYCVSAPWVQSAGRLRCLVQGCCHGSPAPASVGIAYTHPRSRACRIAHLAGVKIHPTPLYSIAWNVVVAMAMTRLWSLHAPTHFIGGIYLLLTGLGRFVEEGYRGEPQTPVYAGLRLYQWIAIGTAIAGALVTALATSGDAAPPTLDAASIAVALAMGVVTATALGVDFPDSQKRFSRLA